MERFISRVQKKYYATHISLLSKRQQSMQKQNEYIFNVTQCKNKMNYFVLYSRRTRRNTLSTICTLSSRSTLYILRTHYTLTITDLLHLSNDFKLAAGIQAMTFKSQQVTEVASYIATS